MSFITFGNLPLSVPPVKDTTPCMDPMLEYEDCIYDAKVEQLEIIHPNWPTIFPRLLTDGSIVEVTKSKDAKTGTMVPDVKQYPLSKKEKQYLWECEEERFIFKSCLRKIIDMKRTKKHTSWNTAEVANLQFH